MKRYFIVQVSERGSKTILNNETAGLGYYRHIGWQLTPKDADHGNVQVGDYLYVYFAVQAVKYQRTFAKAYRVTAITDEGSDNILSYRSRFDLEEIGNFSVPLNDIKEAVESEDLSYDAFGGIGRQGFNIKEVTGEDILNLGYYFTNLKIEKAKEKEMVI